MISDQSASRYFWMGVRRTHCVMTVMRGIRDKAARGEWGFGVQGRSNCMFDCKVELKPISYSPSQPDPTDKFSYFSDIY